MGGGFKSLSIRNYVISLNPQNTGSSGVPTIIEWGIQGRVFVNLSLLILRILILQIVQKILGKKNIFTLHI